MSNLDRGLAAQVVLADMAKIILNQFKLSGLWNWRTPKGKKGAGIPMVVSAQPISNEREKHFIVAVKLGFGNENAKVNTRLRIKFSASNKQAIQDRERAIAAGDTPTATLVAHCQFAGAGFERLAQPDMPLWQAVYLFDCARSFSMKVTFDFLMRLHEVGFISWGR